MLKIIEGVEFDENSKTVSFSKYEDIVDTSLFNNPSKNVRVFPTSKIEKFCNGVDIWSIFRRKRFKTLDGNPHGNYSQEELVKYLSDNGAPQKMIAKALSVSDRTVRNYLGKGVSK